MTKQISKELRGLLALLLATAIMFAVLPIDAFAVTVNCDGYIEVSTIEDLYNIRNDLTANYILMNDIDLTEATADNGDWNYGGRGWNPIGSDDKYGSNAFSGTFDGNGYSIIGMRINADSWPSGTKHPYVGLFSNLAGTVKNLNVINANINVKSTDSNNTIFVGTLAGVAEKTGIIDNCHVEAKIYGYTRGGSGSSDYEPYVGGLIGSSYGTVNNCSMKGSVIAESGLYINTAYAGGICGKGGTISNSYNNAAIEANNTLHEAGNSKGYLSSCAGGISNYATVNDCYNTGNVHASYRLGSADTYASGVCSGIVSKVTNCYNIGKIQIISNYSSPPTISEGYGVGNGTITHSYYLTGTGKNTAGSTELTKKQALTQSLYSKFDFENIWVLNEYANHPYPQLRSNLQDMSESAKLVSIIALPAKTEYLTGDKLDFTGAMVKVVYVSGREEIIKITDEIVSGFNMNTVGEQQVTVTVAGASDKYTINVIERPVVESITVISPPSKNVFTVGTSFDFTGAKALIAYKGGITETVDITFDMTTGGDINHIDKQIITYTFGGQSASFEVEVVGIELNKIVLTKLPDKLSYLEGHKLDLSGMVITAVMNNGIESIVGTGYTVSGYSSEPGKHTITVTYMGKNASFEVTVTKKQLVSLKLNALPDKLEYILGQEFDETGMQIIANYDNGDVEVAEKYVVSGFDNVPGIKNVVVSLDGKSVSFAVKVIARVITDFRLVSVPSKLNYIEYEAFDSTGLKAEATYNDGLTETVADYTLSGFSSKPGTHTITVAYKGLVQSFEINVTPRTLEDVRVIVPNKVVYNIGEEFDGAGMQVVACYNNGQELMVDDYQINGFDSFTAGVKTITVTYGGISRSFAVVVQERSVIKTGGNMIVGSLVGRLGDKVVIPVSVTKNIGIAGFTHTIRFDAKALKLVSVDAVGGYADGTVILNDEKIADGEFTVLWFGSTDVNGDGIVYNITFEVLESAPDGNSEIVIDFADNDNGNVSGENVVFGKINGSVEIRSYWLGDLNGDREYHMVDLLQLAQYVSGKKMTLTEKQLLAADVNEDSVIDIHDVIMLQQWIIAAGVPEA